MCYSLHVNANLQIIECLDVSLTRAEIVLCHLSFRQITKLLVSKKESQQSCISVSQRTS